MKLKISKVLYKPTVSFTNWNGAARNNVVELITLYFNIKIETELFHINFIQTFITVSVKESFFDNTASYKYVVSMWHDNSHFTLERAVHLRDATETD